MAAIKRNKALVAAGHVNFSISRPGHSFSISMHAGETSGRKPKTMTIELTTNEAVCFMGVIAKELRKRILGGEDVFMMPQHVQNVVDLVEAMKPGRKDE